MHGGSVPAASEEHNLAKRLIGTDILVSDDSICSAARVFASTMDRLNGAPKKKNGASNGFD